MTVRRKLLLSVIFSFVLTGLVAGVLGFGIQSLRSVQQQEKQAATINQALAQMHFITFEALLYPGGRSDEQRQLKYENLYNLLATFTPDKGEEEQILEDIRSKHEEVKPLFDSLTATYTKAALQESDIQSLRERLATQIILKQQVEMTGANRLLTLSQEKIARGQRQLAWIVLGILVVMVLATVANLFGVANTITLALTRLQQGALAMGAGKLGYRISKPAHQDEFAELATAFNTMASSLEQVDAVKSQFLTITSHQLRTPLGIMRWGAEDLLSKQLGGLLPEQESQLRAMHEASSKVISRLNEVLLAVSIQKGELAIRKEPADLQALIQAVVEELKPEAEAKHLQVKLELSANRVDYVLDIERMRAAIYALVSNALIYSKEKGQVVVKLEEEAGQIKLSVRDSGVGISSQDQENMYSLFMRGTKASLLYPDGSGLGLYIARAVAQAHGGTLSFRTKEGEGSEFSLVVPGK